MSNFSQLFLHLLQEAACWDGKSIVSTRLWCYPSPAYFSMCTGGITPAPLFGWWWGLSKIMFSFQLLYNKETFKKTHPFISLPFSQSEVWAGFDQVLCLGLHKALARLGSYLRLLKRIGFQAHSSCWHYLVPQSCRTEGLISFWLSARSLLPFLETGLWSFARGLFIFKIVIRGCWTFLASLSPPFYFLDWEKLCY